MPNKQQGLLAFFILQETASILRMRVIGQNVLIETAFSP